MARGTVEFHRVFKKFHRGELHDSLRDLIPALARRAVGRGPRSDQLAADEFWAVRDVSFVVEPGRTLGIIGPNGAGKSTILKLLTGILRPTLGEKVVTGRVGALIEVSAGFHPDLTGRENVFLQGAIMGMSRREIRSKFDDIVAFAGLSEFIDTPVKRYSSGMNARLGFAIAVHLDPDVLIIDEVLAVGDISFQRKAFQRIGEMARRDLPVVIVSHQLDRISEFCTDCILLDHGRVLLEGTPQACISKYVSGELTAPADTGEGPIRLAGIELIEGDVVRSGGRVRLALAGTTAAHGTDGHQISLRVRGLQTGQTVFAVTVESLGIEIPAGEAFKLNIELQANLGSGLYAVEPVVWNSVQRRETAQGPHAIFQVAPDAGFFGSVNMHPTVSLSAERSVS